MPTSLNLTRVASQAEALVDRRIVPAKWADVHTQLRDGLAVLYAELPMVDDRLAKLRAKHATHDELTYFDCRRVLSWLQESPEGAQKNFFGQYSSPVIKRWQALVRMYEKNNVFAAEAARVLTQNTAFEIPFLKKTIQQNDKHVADNKRKIADLHKSIAEYKRKLEASCAAMGIAGVHFRDELRQLPTQLPTLFAEAAAVVCSSEIQAAVEYHSALQQYLARCDVQSLTSVSEGSSQSRKKDKAKTSATTLPVDTTPFAFFSAIAELRLASDTAVDAPVVVDLEAEAVEIDWDISVEDSSNSMGNAEPAEIDWGIETLSTEPSSDEPVEIDWDISTDLVEPAAIEPVDLGAAAVDAGAGADDAVVDTTSRVGLLMENSFRARLLNDLLELKVFLRQRREELRDSTSVAFANQFHGSSPLLEHQSDEQVKRWQDAVEDAYSRLTDKRLQQLVLIKSSDRYLDRHVASFEMLTKHIAKCEREIKTLEDKNMDLVDASARLHPQIDALVVKTKSLKRELEDTLTPLFRGFKVNIVGDINSL
ncbi:hypothetical protein P43SY_001944 [Pythium insidiosum]|uniref:Uncharacterized protein n=1 Tax=Pythium insidiosum TaxID=114742 RepID=A0AAD5MAH7_PYTIN|nr:hypothetical protein P43SY_001944 [Pythium insidiosum]